MHSCTLFLQIGRFYVRIIGMWYTDFSSLQKDQITSPDAFSSTWDLWAVHARRVSTQVQVIGLKGPGEFWLVTIKGYMGALIITRECLDHCKKKVFRPVRLSDVWTSFFNKFEALHQTSAQLEEISRADRPFVIRVVAICHGSRRLPGKISEVSERVGVPSAVTSV